MTTNELILSYLYNKEEFLRNDLTQHRNNVLVRGYDTIDLQEEIRYMERLDMFREVVYDIHKLLLIGQSLR